MNPLIKKIVIIASKITNSGPGVYHDDFNDCALTYDNVITRPILAEATVKLLTGYGPSAGDRCIDLGCGTGHSTEIIAKRIAPDGSVVACDFSEMMIAKAKSRMSGLSSVSYMTGDMFGCLGEFQNKSFDFAGLFWSLEYVNHAELLTELGRVMKTGARVSLLVNLQTSLAELQELIAPILIRNILCLKKIPPLNFLPGIEQFKKTVEKAGFALEHISEETVAVSFKNGPELVSWMKNGGPSAGFKSSIREKKRDRIFSLISETADRSGRLSVTFRYISYSGIRR